MLSALPTAPSCARQVCRLQLAEWGLVALSDSCDLIVSELASNAVRACEYLGRPAQLGIRLSVRGERVRIEVWDPAPGLPRLNADATELDETGRGLHLVDALSAGRWGTHPCPDGTKIVWAEIGG
jgi:anti-sigma regulatory factor (Ser/Thr protein kinase)